MAAVPTVNIGLDYDEELTTIRSFLSKFKSVRREHDAEGDVRFDDGAAEELDDLDLDHLGLEELTGIKYIDQLVRPSSISSRTKLRASGLHLLTLSCGCPIATRRQSSPGTRGH